MNDFRNSDKSYFVEHGSVNSKFFLRNCLSIIMERIKNTHGKKQQFRMKIKCFEKKKTTWISNLYWICKTFFADLDPLQLKSNFKNCVSWFFLLRIHHITRNFNSNCSLMNLMGNHRLSLFFFFFALFLGQELLARGDLKIGIIFCITVFQWHNDIS